MPSNQTPNYNLNQWSKDDRVLMEDFNADNAKIDAALQTEAGIRAAAVDALTKSLNQKADHAAVAAKVSIITGAYTGNRKASRVIDLGCQPKAVLLMRYDGETYFNNYIFGGLILPGHPLGGSVVSAEIVSNGFRVTYGGGDSRQTNTNTDYVYIAFV